MPYIINDECTSCGLCAIQCPVECISEGERNYIINSSCCVDCGTCEEVCPVGAALPTSSERVA
jgi:NAD-dependent dihydropyrimidine dehydrogenase PreA subunit